MGRELRVLVVDDDGDLQEVISAGLAEVGIAVTTAGNGAEALAVLTSSRPDVILIDMVMPVMDGAEFRRRQLATPAIAEIPTIVMTGSVTLDYIRRLQPADMLAKPFTMDQLYSVLARYT